MSTVYATVVVPASTWSTEETLLYIVPPALVEQAQAGVLVSVPYGVRIVPAVLWQCFDVPPENSSVPLEELRPIQSVLDTVPVLQAYQQRLAEWMSAYYVTPLPACVSLFLPAGLLHRVKIGLALTETYTSRAEQPISPEQSALLSLLLSHEELDEPALARMLGVRRAHALVRQAIAEGILEQKMELPASRPSARTVCLVPSALAEIHVWLMQTETAQEKAVQRQRAMLQLLLANPDVPWTSARLCKATQGTPTQLKKLLALGWLALQDADLTLSGMSLLSALPESPLQLTSAQSDALTGILQAEKPMLLYGVTGSGKTEVYLHAVASVLAQGRQAWVLVPEIALTMQAMQRFQARFPGKVAMLHSDMTPAQRYRTWCAIRDGQVAIVLGARSALFAPLPHPGLIILDEEHDPSYKESMRQPMYHARTVAERIACTLHIPLVLGSATPSIESYHRATDSRGSQEMQSPARGTRGVPLPSYHLITLPHRIGVAVLPQIEVVDVRTELLLGHRNILSRAMQIRLRETLAQGQQAMLFLNRRGTASMVLCRECGFVQRCLHCEMPVTYHATEHLLICHYCSTRASATPFCPQCQGRSIGYIGIGTERLEKSVQELFPDARILRWDRDTSRSYHQHAQILEAFQQHEADILIGTQLITKGFDIPSVTFVGIVLADVGLFLPDFATSERMFSLLTQVAGRAGRGALPGHVVLQTYNPEHFCIQAAMQQEYRAFFAGEITMREQFGYPPFQQFAVCYMRDASRYATQQKILQVFQLLEEEIAAQNLTDVSMVGPVPSFIEKRGEYFQWQLLLRGHGFHHLLALARQHGCIIDVDPVSLL